MPFAAGSFGATGRARAVAKPARAMSVICMMMFENWIFEMAN